MLGKYGVIGYTKSVHQSYHCGKNTPISDPVMSWWGRIPEDHEKTGTVFFCRYRAVFCCWTFIFFTIQHSKLLKSKNWLMKSSLCLKSGSNLLIIGLKSLFNPCQISMDCFLEVKLPQSQCFLRWTPLKLGTYSGPLPTSFQSNSIKSSSTLKNKVNFSWLKLQFWVLTSPEKFSQLFHVWGSWRRASGPSPTPAAAASGSTMQHLDEGFWWDLMMIDGYLWLPHSQWAIFYPWHGYLSFGNWNPKFWWLSYGWAVAKSSYHQLKTVVFRSDKLQKGLKKHPKIGGVSDFATRGDAPYNPTNYRYWYIQKILWYIMIYHL